MADLEPMKVEYPVKNTFIDYPVLRSMSLEAFLLNRESKSCPSSAISHGSEEAVVSAQAPTAVLSGQEAERLAEKIGYLVKNTFVEIPAQRSLSLEDFLHERAAKSCPVSEIQQGPSSDESTAASTPPDTFRHDVNTEPEHHAVRINLTEGLGIWSAGSAGHEFGRCKPCAFIWKEDGCQSGAACPFCHLCPPDEIKRRKKNKLSYRKMVNAIRRGMF